MLHPVYKFLDESIYYYEHRVHCGVSIFFFFIIIFYCHYIPLAVFVNILYPQ